MPGNSQQQQGNWPQGNRMGDHGNNMSGGGIFQGHNPPPPQYNVAMAQQQMQQQQMQQQHNPRFAGGNFNPNPQPNNSQSNSKRALQDMLRARHPGPNFSGGGGPSQQQQQQPSGQFNQQRFNR